jgi:Uma2 family endonuclease
MSKHLEELLCSPRLRLYYERIHAMLEAETQLRQQFYDLIAEGGRAEFINGEIIMHSPVKLKYTNASRRLLNLLATFVERHDLGFVGYEKTLISLSRNDYVPEICFFGRTKTEGFSPDQFKFPAPDFVVEFLTPGTRVTDCHIKLEDYAAHGVLEYWIIDSDKQTLEQYILESDTYALHTRARSGDVSSVAVPAFDIPIRAIFDGTENVSTLQRLVGSNGANGSNGEH